MRDEQQADCRSVSSLLHALAAESRATEQNILEGTKTPAECLNSHG